MFSAKRGICQDRPAIPPGIVHIRHFPAPGNRAAQILAVSASWLTDFDHKPQGAILGKGCGEGNCPAIRIPTTTSPP